MAKIEKITVERVFNIGDYQTIRFGMEVSTEELTTQEAVTNQYRAALDNIETAFNQIAEQREAERKRLLEQASSFLSTAERMENLKK